MPIKSTEIVSAGPVTRPRVARSLLVGLGALVTVLAAQRWGALGGWPLLLAGAAASLAIPSSRELARRVAVVGCVALGAAPLLWWFAVPDIGATRFGVVVAILVGGLAGWVALGDARSRLRRLLPRLRSVDAVAAVGVALAAWTLWPLLGARDGQAALSAMLAGWDYAAHFDMAEMIRRYGVVISQAPGGPWQYADYPQGFHAAAATLMEVTVGRVLGSPEAELVGFARATALVCLLALATLVAALVALPALRRRPLAAAPLVALVVLAFTWGPGGGHLIAGGFPNFFVAAALLAAVPLVVIPLGRLSGLAPIATLAGAVVGIAHSWALLLVIVVPAVLIAFAVPPRRRRWPSSGAGWVRVVTVGVATLLGCWGAVQTLGRGEAGASLFLAPGGFTGASKAEIVLPVVCALAACLAAAYVARRRRTGTPRSRSDDTLRAGWMAAVPVVGALLITGIAAMQLAAGVGLQYYFWKTATAVQLVCVVLFVGVTATLLPTLIEEVKRHRLAVVGFSGAGVALLLTSAGILSIASAGLMPRTPPGLAARAAWLERPGGAGSSGAPDILAAAGTPAEGPSYLVPSNGLDRTAPRLLNQWLFASTGQWTVEKYRVVNDIWGDATPEDSRPDSVPDAVGRILAAAPGAVVLVDPADWDGLEARANEGRIVPWG